MKKRLAAFAVTVRRTVGVILLLAAFRLVQFWFGDPCVFLLVVGFILGLLVSACIVDSATKTVANRHRVHLGSLDEQQPHP